MFLAKEANSHSAFTPQNTSKGSFFGPKNVVPNGRNMVQRSGEEGTTRVSNPLGELMAKQLSDKEFKKHIISLGDALQKLALEATDPAKNPSANSTQLGGAQSRFTALHIKFLFETQADLILKDPALKSFREQVAGIVKGSPTTAVMLALTGLVAAYLGNIGLKIPDIDEKIGAGFSAGGSADAGKAQSPEIKHADVFVKFAAGLFSVKVQGSVDQKEDKKGEYVGAGKAEVKVGNEDTAATVGVKVDTSGKYVLTGNVKTDLLGGEKKDFQLYTDVKWPIGSSDVMLKPGFAAKYKLGEQRSFVFGSSVDVSTLTGLKNVEGYLEYRDGLTRLRFDANLSGIARERSLLPGQDVRFQVTLTLPLP